MDNLWIFLQIIMINILLSGDNAVVIAMASRQLPSQQRKRAVWWGSFAAVGLRCLLTLAAISLLKLPYLQAAGSVLLVWIAVKLLHDAEAGRRPGTSGARPAVAATLAGAVWTIVTADFIMSLDNVLAVAAVADGEPVLMMLGIILSIPMIIWGSHVLGKLLARYPSLVYAGSGLLGYAAGEMLVSDPGLHGAFARIPLAHAAIPVLFIPLVIVLGIATMKKNRP
ncbi:TerC family protein [Paenibacillus sp. RUD330]|uniref:TerC family protein n=1 Tax=Paenibacillus sp. RUD330 TaxID=2023772 RepID=UPI000F0EEFAE|nr:TerC family protein [Paenibacillus sp. RUD330]